MLLRPRRTTTPRVKQQRFITDELVTVLLQNRAGEGFTTHNKDELVVLLQLIYERDEIAVAAHDRKRVDVIVSECQLQGVERKIDVCAILIPARRRIALDHLDRVLRHLPRG